MLKFNTDVKIEQKSIITMTKYISQSTYQNKKTQAD